MQRLACLAILFLVVTAAALSSDEPAVYRQEYQTLQQGFQAKLKDIKSREEYQPVLAQYKKDLEALLAKQEGAAATDDLELWRAEAMMELDQYQPALAKADALIAKASPLSPKASLLKVNILMQTDDLDGALKTFRAAEAGLPRNEEFYQTMMMFTMGGDPKVRREYSEKILAADLSAFPSMARAKTGVQDGLNQLDLIGKPAPAISAPEWVNGEAMTLESLKGKVVVIDFWAPWCPPCRQVIPSLVKAYDELKEKGLVVIGFTKYYGNYRDDIQNKGKVAPADEMALIKEFLGRYKITYPIPVANGNDVFNAYFVKGIPTMVLIGKTGEVAAIHVGSGDEAGIRREIEKLLE